MCTSGTVVIDTLTYTLYFLPSFLLFISFNPPSPFSSLGIIIKNPCWWQLGFPLLLTSRPLPESLVIGFIFYRSDKKYRKRNFLVFLLFLHSLYSFIRFTCFPYYPLWPSLYIHFILMFVYLLIFLFLQSSSFVFTFLHPSPPTPSLYRRLILHPHFFLLLPSPFSPQRHNLT